MGHKGGHVVMRLNQGLEGVTIEGLELRFVEKAITVAVVGTPERLPLKALPQWSEVRLGERFRVGFKASEAR